MRAPTVIDLFSGAGGLSEGFRQAGFRVLAGNDIDRFAGETFAAMHPEAAFVPGRVESVSGTDLLNAAKLERGDLDCLIGGPPCQGYSVYNHQRGMDDDRSILFREYLRHVEALLPRWIVMENVTGITSAGGGEAVKGIQAGLASLGYATVTRILRAEDYGVPQERRRLFFVGNRTGLAFVWPGATHGPLLQDPVTVWDAIGDLPRLENGEAPDGPQAYDVAAFSAYQTRARGNGDAVTHHAAPRLSAVNLERMRHIPEGGSWRDIPFDLLPKGMKSARRCDHTKRYGRLRKGGLSPTILTKCDVHWSACIHPEQDRALTVREAARLQSFPDRFTFAGPRTAQYVQVGNAVPPLLGRRVAEAILSAEEIPVAA